MDQEAQCTAPGCTQFDFLPARCTYCRATFCSGHLRAESHRCAMKPAARHTVACPVCNQTLVVPTGTSVDQFVARHIDAGCPQSTATGGGTDAAPVRLNFCSLAGCSRNEITLILCSHCGQSFCVDHRSAAAHRCVVKPSTTSPPPATISPSRRPPSPQPSQSQRIATATAFVNTAAAPLGLLPGRSPPEGGLPLRVYFSDGSTRPIYMRVPADTSVGRLLDAACTHAGLRNDNHLKSSDEEKLFLHNVRLTTCLAPGLKIEECCAANEALLVAKGTALAPDVLAVVTQLSEGKVVKRSSSDAAAPTATKPKEQQSDGCRVA